MTDLELATNDELIEELLRRSTFRGVIIHQRANYRGKEETAWRWDARKCDVQQVLRDLLPQLPPGGEGEDG